MHWPPVELFWSGKLHKDILEAGCKLVYFCWSVQVFVLFMFQPHSTSARFNCMTRCHECFHHFKGTSQILCTFCFLSPYLTHEEVYSSLRQSCADIKSNFSILSFCRWSYWTCTSSVLRRQTAIAAVPQMSPLTVNGGGFIHSKTPDQTCLSLSITLLITALQLILSTHFVPSCHLPPLWKYLLSWFQVGGEGLDTFGFLDLGYGAFSSSCGSHHLHISSNLFLLHPFCF